CALHSAQAHRCYSHSYVRSCICRTRDYIEREPVSAPVEQHFYPSRSYCRWNLIALLPELKPVPVLRLVLVLIGFTSWMFAAVYCGVPHENSTLSISMG